MENFTEEQLRQQLIEKTEERKRNEKKEKDEATEAAYERCKDSEFIVNHSEYPSHVTYRRISDIKQGNESGEKVNHCKLMEQVIISHRDFVSESNVYGTEKSIRISANYEDMTGARGTVSWSYIQKDDFPTSKEEFERAKQFAISQSDIFKGFFTFNTDSKSFIESI